MNSAEKRILYGLYNLRSRIGESHVFSAFSLNWLANHDYSEAAAWSVGSKLQEHQIADVSEQENEEIQSGAAAAALEHLAGAKLIRYTFATGAFFHFNVELTYEGAMLARRLRTPWGRVGLWYAEHRDGIAGLVITMAVSAITSLIVAWIERH